MPPKSAPRPRSSASAAQGISLRSVPTGYNPSRLPVAVRPEPDEPAASWAVRLAYRYQMGVRPLLAELGIETHAWTLQNFDNTLRPHQSALCDALGLPEQELFTASEEGQALRLMLGRYFKQYRPRRTLGPAGTRYCPECLRDRDGAWKQEWQQPLAMVCLDHKVELRTVCPQCNMAPWTSGSWLSSTSPAWECSRPLKAAQRAPRQRIPRCGFDLRRGPLVEPPDVRVAVRVQQLLNRFARLAHLAPDETGEFLGRAFRFDDLFFTLMEVLNASYPNPVRRPYEPFWITTSPGEQLRGLCDGVLALTSPDPEAAAERLSHVLRPGSRQAPLYAIQNIRRHQHNPVLGHIMLSANAPSMSPTLQLTFRTANRRPRYPAEAVRDPQGGLPPRDGELPLSSVPQMLWSGAIPSEFHRTELDRAIDAMMLGRLGTLRSWQHLAIELGLPAAFRTYPPARIRWLRNRDLWHPFHVALDDLASRLAQDPPPVDYQQRRRTGSDGALIHACVDRVLATRANPVATYDTRSWARAFWQIYTEGDLRLAPQPLGIGLSSGAAPPPVPVDQAETEDFLQQIRWVLERSVGVDDDGPLRWVPP